MKIFLVFVLRKFKVVACQKTNSGNLEVEDKDISLLNSVHLKSID